MAIACHVIAIVIILITVAAAILLTIECGLGILGAAVPFAANIVFAVVMWCEPSGENLITGVVVAIIATPIGLVLSCLCAGA